MMNTDFDIFETLQIKNLLQRGSEVLKSNPNLISFLT